jgi:hypothetical protein
LIPRCWEECGGVGWWFCCPRSFLFPACRRTRFDATCARDRAIWPTAPPPKRVRQPRPWLRGSKFAYTFARSSIRKFFHHPPGVESRPATTTVAGGSELGFGDPRFKTSLRYLLWVVPPSPTSPTPCLQDLMRVALGIEPSADGSASDGGSATAATARGRDPSVYTVLRKRL